jgi:hypothetical protein
MYVIDYRLSWHMCEALVSLGFLNPGQDNKDEALYNGVVFAYASQLQAGEICFI